MLLRPFFYFLLLFAASLPAQTPFTCDGRMYRVVEEQGGSTFQEITIDLVAGTSTFTDRHFFGGSRINGIAYRPADNLIYGVLLGDPYVLCRIDADFQLESLRALDLPADMLFVSGDVSPDERYLVLLGFRPENNDNLLALIDLSRPDYPMTIIPLAKNNPTAALYCADIAFHPTLDLLFGFEHSEGRLITIDLANGLVDNTSYPVVPEIQGNMPSLFFNAYGELFGIGAALDVFTNRNLYHFNTVDGSAVLFDELGFERNQDACSCPFKVEVLNRVSNRQAYPCTRLEFEFTLLNRTDREQEGLSFRDTFPEGTLIQSIGALPFAGNVVSGVGSNILAIENIRLPLGAYSFMLDLAILETAAPQLVFNYAYLDNVIIDNAISTTLVFSDDPETPANDDPTAFEIKELAIDFAKINPYLCFEDTLLLSTGIDNASFYQWSTGVTGPDIIVTQPGTYAVTVQTPCAEVNAAIVIVQDDLSVTIGNDRTIERGEEITWTPTINSLVPIQLYLWHEAPVSTLSCITCEMPLSRPLVDSHYKLLVENANGCIAMADAQVKILGPQVYAPNIFSPNRDGINDYFYLQSPQDYKIRRLQIFDRWGGMQYEQVGILSNQALIGWDGTANGRSLGAGVFVWQAELEGQDGERFFLSGDITLIR
ncbi:T9SS C-terminal target domain-containing protein [Lewinella cohaerens]|uniref:T9SS C-terminal target domain-containing protein n=1 Tax=Lewinella cohaerens TaxID=70995 RepID=UPI00035D80C0|nr:T9SS C-terminal target domain-containing protein [Lewinella cohaerens]